MQLEVLGKRDLMFGVKHLHMDHISNMKVHTFRWNFWVSDLSLGQW